MDKAMKKIVVTVIIIIFSIVLFIFFKNIFGWKEFRKNTDTPQEFRSIVKASKQSYAADSTKLQMQFKELLLKHDDFFSSRAYDNSTQIIIDSIIYAPTLKRLAIFIIIKNSTSKQVIPNMEHKWYYNATCYLGIRQNNTILLSRVGPNFTNSYSKRNVSRLIREACFRTFSKDNTVYEYNLNDKRFWNSKIWTKVKDDIKRKKAFEIEKTLHPEDVYDPNDLN